MKINKCYNFRLEPNHEQIQLLNQAIGCARFVYNNVLATSFEMFHLNQHIKYETIEKYLKPLKDQYEFLGETFSACVQQKVKDLAKAWDKFFDPKEHARYNKRKKKKKSKARFFKLADGTELQLRPLMPRFKRKNDSEQSFRIPFQGKCAVQANRVRLPKEMGWIKFKKSQEIVGKILNITIKRISGKWYISFATVQEVDNPTHPSKSSVGIDLGIKKFATTSNGEVFLPKNSFKRNQIKLAKLQRKLKKKVKFSENWKKANRKIAHLHHHIANIRQDYSHKVTTALSKNHAMIAVEDLEVANMSKSASGTLENQGKNVKAKSGLNKSILDQGWSMFVDMLEYKQLWRGGLLVKVDPKYTSQKCSCCGHIAKENRQTQSRFECVECGFNENADINASRNILSAGHAVLSVDGGGAKAKSSVKQKASEIREEVT